MLVPVLSFAAILLEPPHVRQCTSFHDRRKRAID